MDKYKCPCCGEKTLESYGQYDICKVCDWEDCPYMREEPNETSGANDLPLNEYRERWKQQKSSK